MLNLTKVELELILDADIYLFFKKGIKSCHSKQEPKHIIILDANNLYYQARFKFLPTSGFKWIDPKNFLLNKYSRHSSKGCAVKVDLECHIFMSIAQWLPFDYR